MIGCELIAAESLYVWCKAMTMYHRASKVVKPKLEALNLAQNRLHEAEVCALACLMLLLLL